MSIQLAKENFINLKKAASEAVVSVGLNDQKAKVALALDISGSMYGLFTNGTVQKVVEELLALGIKFDDNQAIDVFLFGRGNYEVGELTESDFYGYVKSKIQAKYELEGSTNYAGVMDRIVTKYTTENHRKGLFGRTVTTTKATLDEPVFVIFITDGDNQDKIDTETVIRKASKQGIFWQFVGIGHSSFNFLQKLDDLSGRFIDNADFIQVDDIGKVNETELYKRLLGEFPDWIKEAKSKNLIK